MDLVRKEHDLETSIVSLKAGSTFSDYWILSLKNLDNRRRFVVVFSQRSRAHVKSRKIFHWQSGTKTFFASESLIFYSGEGCITNRRLPLLNDIKTL